MRKWLKRLALTAGILLAVIGVVGAVAGFWLHARLMASLPVLDGERAVEGLLAPVEVERDELGVPTIRAESRLDLARATGWLHAQERFTQMDLMRRQAAGELAELVGEGALELDREHRVHRFRARARVFFHAGGDETRALLEAYAEGVNSGLAALRAAPPEYLLLRAEPEPWQPEDTILVLLGMYLLLQGDDGWRESSLGLLHDAVPAELFDFLVPPGTNWDAPLQGGPLPTPPIPSASVIDLRTLEPPPIPGDERSPGNADRGDENATGSNNWAVAGTFTADGGALLANDMHLPLGLPNIWYRASFEWRDEQAPGETLRITGATLAGTPAMVVGSNGHIAWGFTNAYADTHDLVLLEIDPGDENRYRTPGGYVEFERHEEIIRIKGGEPATLEVLDTIWGPVIGEDNLGRRRALRWVAHDHAAVNLRLTGLEQARDIDEAMAVARRCGIPVQNLVVADAGGRIGWTLIGMLPRRVGLDGMLPSSWADGSRGWDGWLEPEEYPSVVDPPSGRIWTANNRIIDQAALPRVGMRGYILGARAGQIRDRLLALDGATAGDMLAIQLDDRALFMEPWRGLLLDALTPEAVAADPRRAELRRLVEETWTGRASPESVAYRMVRAFRSFLAEQVFDAILEPWSSEDITLDYTGPVTQWEGPLWKLVTERPSHLLDPRLAGWDEQLLTAVDGLLDYYEENYESGLDQRTWGERNTVSVQHPLSRAVPRLSGWLDIEPRPMPGDSRMPRVQQPRFGASERFAVSPGREDEGYFHMPGGQSGHPMSPFYRAGHEAWVDGEPTPFLPGPAVHHLTLTP
jgi:penicillin amidase